MWENSESQIVAAARLRNLDMPRRAVRQIKEENGNLVGLKIGVLGITYRAGVKETAFSGALDLMRYLQQEKVDVFGLDPYYKESEIINFGFSGVADLSEVDGVILHTDHPEFLEIDFEKFSNIKFLYDGRRSLEKYQNSASLKYLTY
jgi:UDP-N-acetyl-D-mannosaminuronate dehydrogenase